MVDPKHEPGFEPKPSPKRPQKSEEREQKDIQKKRWRDRMHSKLIRMSRGAQNFWLSLPWSHKENWRRKDKKK